MKLKERVMKAMHIKASLALYLKDKPKTYLGASGESWNFGDKPMTLDKQIYEIAITLADFYRACGVLDVIDANAAIRQVANQLIATADLMDARIEGLRQEAEPTL